MSVSNQNLFAEFAPTSKKTWLAKIEKDLKGRPLAELNWVLDGPLPTISESAISIAPFLHADDFEVQPEPILDNRSANTWAVAEDVDVTDFKAANKQTLAALMAGVNAPRFVFDDFPTKQQLAILLENVSLDYISTHFKEKTENRSPLSFLKNFHTLAGKQASELKGAVHYDPFSDGRFDVKAASDVVVWASENLPQFVVITINVKNTDGTSRNNREGAYSELLNALIAGNDYLKKLTDNGLSVETIQKHIAFRFQIGSSYFLEIAKLRAFKLLWGNLLAAYNTTPATPQLFACTSAIAPDEDANIHKIKATTQAMSAIMAGVDTLTVSPSEASDFGRRVARNVQHLMSMESYLDRVTDPAAGSYYIEKMTEQLAEAVWTAFQNQN